MSQRMVGRVINRLLHDEDLRVRFALDRIEALAALSIALTPDELDVFIQTDPRVWFWGSAVMGDGRTDDADGTLRRRTDSRGR
jgi:hypothetical protein